MFRIPAEGVWIWQNDIGEKILDMVLNKNMNTTREESWNSIYDKKTFNVDAETIPLHHVGGYDMFDEYQWDNQVWKLMSYIPDAQFSAFNSMLGNFVYTI